jgi:uncharacterized membrane protein
MVSDRVSRAALVAVCIAGIAIAGYLTWVHYEPASLICTAGGGCEQVQESDYATLAGIPVAVLGLVAWVVALVLALWDSALARTLLAALSLAALAFSVYLVILQLVVIDAVCIWCLANDLALVPALTVLSVLRLRQHGPDQPTSSR